MVLKQKNMKNYNKELLSKLECCARQAVITIQSVISLTLNLGTLLTNPFL